MPVINAVRINSAKCVSPISTIKVGLLCSDLQLAAKPAQNMHLEEAGRADRIWLREIAFLLPCVAREHASLSASNKQLVICRNIK